MNAEQVALARRLLTHEGFEWMPGMLGVRDAPGCSDHLKQEVRVQAPRDVWTAEQFGSLPDLSDWATGGALLSLLPRGQWVIMSGENEVQLELNTTNASLLGRSLGEVVAKALLGDLE